MRWLSLISFLLITYQHLSSCCDSTQALLQGFTLHAIFKPSLSPSFLWDGNWDEVHIWYDLCSPYLQVILQHNVAIITFKAIISILNIAVGSLLGCCGLSAAPCMLSFTAISVVLGFAVPTYIGRRWEQEGRIEFANHALYSHED